MKKKPLIIFSVILLILAGTFIGGFLFLKVQLGPMVKGESTHAARIEIPYGATVTQVAQQLEDEQIIRNSKLFYYSVRFPFVLNLFFSEANSNNNFQLKSGTYFVQNNLNFLEIQKLLSSGQQEYVIVSFPEGLTISLIGKILEDNKICSKEDFIKSTTERNFKELYGIPGKTLEGYLFPDTYYFNYNMDSDHVVDIMVKNFFDKISTIENLSDKSPEELHEIVKLASIVEKEYRVPEEAPLIASVFKNRLRHNIGLYSCATIVYILTEIEGRDHPDKVLIKDTRIESPYNTYLHAGLPPGPISNPGLIALDAGVNTPKTNYYFFQIVDQNAGKHVFSETFEEHKIAHTLNVK